MRADLQSLYRETLIEQSRNPKNNYILEGANRRSELKNPLCGDVVTIYPVSYTHLTLPTIYSV